MIQVVLIEKQIITWKGVSKKFKNISLLREFFARFNFACFTRASGVKNHGKCYWEFIATICWRNG